MTFDEPYNGCPECHEYERERLSLEHEIERLQAELVNSNAQLHNKIDEAREAARWLYHKHNVPAWDDYESQKHGDMIREEAKQRWPWLEEEE